MSTPRSPITLEQLERAAKVVRELLAASDGADGGGAEAGDGMVDGKAEGAADGTPKESGKDASRQDVRPRGVRLVELGHDVVSRQCETGTLVTGEPYVRVRAEEHGVERKSADTPLGNVLVILERGPEGNDEWCLLAALFVAGVERRAQALSAESERPALLRRVAGWCLWLELSTHHRVLPLLPQLLSEDIREQLLGALGDGVLEEDQEQAEGRARGRNAVRISALAQADGDAARAALERIASAARDPFSRALGALALGRPSPGADSADEKLEGRVGRFPAGAFRSLLRWASGWALLMWALRLLASILGVRRRAQVELRGQSLTIRRETSLLGRPIRTVEQTLRIAELRAARRAARYPYVHLLVGVLCLSLGVVLGGLFFYDGARAGDITLLLLAAALWLGGAGLDLALDVLVPARLGTVALDLDLGARARTRLTGVDQAAADRLLSSLSARLSAVEAQK